MPRYKDGTLAVWPIVFVPFLVTLALLFAGCGGKPAPASPVHTVNVFFDGLSHNDFRQVCSVVKGFPTAAQCEQYFTVNAAISGGGLTGHAVPHSEVVRGDTATVRGVDSGGTRYVATLTRQKDGGWKLTSVSAA